MILQKNVTTGKVTTREYTQKELANIAAYQPTQTMLDARLLEQKRLAAIKAEEEKMLLSGTTDEAKAYQLAKP